MQIDFTESNIYWQNVLDNFEAYYPSIAEHTTEWYQCGRNQILVNVDDGNKYIYDDIDSTIQLVTNCFADEPIEKEDFARDFGYKFSDAMAHAGMSQLKLSERTGISYVSISCYARGKSLPSVYNLYLICKILGCSPSEFFPLYEEAKI